jgi:hypothetical protein
MSILEVLTAHRVVRTILILLDGPCGRGLPAARSKVLDSVQVRRAASELVNRPHAVVGVPPFVSGFRWIERGVESLFSGYWALREESSTGG